MRYTYAYKTSDGTRHEAAMDAESREQVFVALRERGIRAIKVVAADGSKANGEVRGVRKRVVAAAVAVAALAAGLLTYFVQAPAETRVRGIAAADGVRERLRAEYAALRADRLTDGREVLATTNVTALYRVAERGEAVVSRARNATREAFARIAAEAEGEEEMRAVQRAYGERMAEIDALEIANANRKYALALLDGNRGKWELRDGKPVFSDRRLAKMFDYCLEGISTDAATSRWRKDFGNER